MNTEPGDLGASDRIWEELVIDDTARQPNTIRDKPGVSRSQASGPVTREPGEDLPRLRKSGVIAAGVGRVEFRSDLGEAVL